MTSLLVEYNEDTYDQVFLNSTGAGSFVYFGRPGAPSKNQGKKRLLHAQLLEMRERMVRGGPNWYETLAPLQRLYAIEDALRALMRGGGSGVAAMGWSRAQGQKLLTAMRSLIQMARGVTHGPMDWLLVQVNHASMLACLQVVRRLRERAERTPPAMALFSAEAQPDKLRAGARAIRLEAKREKAASDSGHRDKLLALAASKEAEAAALEAHGVDELRQQFEAAPAYREWERAKQAIDVIERVVPVLALCREVSAAMNDGAAAVERGEQFEARTVQPDALRAICERVLGADRVRDWQFVPVDQLFERALQAGASEDAPMGPAAVLSSGGGGGGGGGTVIGVATGLHLKVMERMPTKQSAAAGQKSGKSNKRSAPKNGSSGGDDAGDGAGGQSGDKSKGDGAAAEPSMKIASRGETDCLLFNAATGQVLLWMEMKDNAADVPKADQQRDNNFARIFEERGWLELPGSKAISEYKKRGLHQHHHHHHHHHHHQHDHHHHDHHSHQQHGEHHLHLPQQHHGHVPLKFSAEHFDLFRDPVERIRRSVLVLHEPSDHGLQVPSMLQTRLQGWLWSDLENEVALMALYKAIEAATRKTQKYRTPLEVYQLYAGANAQKSLVFFKRLSSPTS